jgi:hypothetical protein
MTPEEVRDSMTADEAWREQCGEVFDVVADIDPPSARIAYAFKAGYVAATARSTGESLAFDALRMLPPVRRES